MNEYAGCQVTNDVEIGADDIEPSLTAFLEIDKEEISGGEAGKNRIWNGLAEFGNRRISLALWRRAGDGRARYK